MTWTAKVLCTVPRREGRASVVGRGGLAEGEEVAEQRSSALRADIRLYEVVHTAFRKATDRFVDATGRMDPAVIQPLIGSRWAFYTGVLNHHHHTEDDSVFPELVVLRPDLKELIGSLEKDHQRLIERMSAVDAAVAGLEKQPDIEHRDVLHAAIVAVREAFFPHLDAEDAQILPAIAESMPPAQWKRLDEAALRTIPRKYLPTAVGALDEVMHDVPVDRRPAPPPPPIRLMLALSWRRKYAAFIKPFVV